MLNLVNYNQNTLLIAELNKLNSTTIIWSKLKKNIDKVSPIEKGHLFNSYE